MKRSTWSAVLVTVLVLAAAGTLPRLSGHGVPLARAAAAWAAHAAEGAGARVVVGVLVARAEWSGVRGVTVAPPPAWAGGLSGIAVLLAGALAWGRTRRRRRPAGRPAHRVRRALVMARDGRDAASIARELGLAQDAVRALLRPAPPRRVRSRARLVAR